jgi:hypothetical protein
VSLTHGRSDFGLEQHEFRLGQSVLECEDGKAASIGVAAGTQSLEVSIQPMM